MLFGQKKLPLLCGPTPLLPMEALSRELGIKLYFKRDDMTPLGMGGNKLRKLEYLAAEAVERGATTLLTMGGVQTNHGRLTAAVAAKLGLKCHIICIDSYPGELSANLLLDRIMGAEVTLRESDGRPQDVQLAELEAEVTARLEAAGERVYSIPVGGSNAVGLLGYYECALELTDQAIAMNLGDARVVVAAGSLGTYLGLFCGLKESASPLSLTGVAISTFDESKMARLLEYHAEVRARFGLKAEAEAGDFHMETGYVRGGYNIPSREVREAVELVARREGVLLDPCYTGKAFAGLVDMVREGKISQGETVIFLHTGGMPGLYTAHHRREMEAELLSGVDIQRA